MTKIKLAVADDHVHFRTVLVKSLLLLNKGLEVIVQAKDGLDLIEQLHRSSVDVVLTDYSVPNLERLDLLNTLKETFPAIPVIFMSFGNNPQVRTNLLAAGAAGFIPKNENLSVLYALMVDAINSKKENKLPNAFACQ